MKKIISEFDKNKTDPFYEKKHPTSSSYLTLLTVVEDERFSRYKDCLSDRFGTVNTATLQKALEIAVQQSFHFILIALSKPALNSIHLIKKIRSLQGSQSCRIILLATRREEQLCLQGIHAGANDYLIAPFSRQELLLRVETQLKFLECESKNDDLTHLHKISQSLRSRDVLSSRLKTLVKAFVEFARADMGNIQLYDSRSHALYAVSDHGFTQPMQQYLSLMNEGNYPCREAVRLEKPIHVGPIEDSAFYQNTPALAVLQKSGICSMMAIPMITYGRIMGVIAVYWKRCFYPAGNVLKVLDLLAHETANLIQHRQHEEILQAQKLKAEENSHAKDLFLATLSHELRSPLTAILTWAQLLKTNCDSKEKLAIGLNAIEDSAMTQNTIINDLMDISGTILGKISMETQPADLNQLIKISVDSMRASAEKKALNISMFCSKSLIVSCDPTRIKQVFSNLLANAIKFTPEGGKITIRSRPTIQSNQGYAEITFSVTPQLPININKKSLKNYMDMIKCRDERYRPLNNQATGKN